MGQFAAILAQFFAAIDNLVVKTRANPVLRAASAAAVHSGTGFGKRALCPSLQRSKRRQTFRMPTGISTVL
jgi:hypothetical protein